MPRSSHGHRLALPALIAFSLTTHSPAAPAWPGTPGFASLWPRGAQAGTSVTLEISGQQLIDPRSILVVSTDKIRCTAISPTSPPTDSRGRSRAEPNSTLSATLEIAPDCPIGLHGLRILTAAGLSDLRIFSVGRLPESSEAESRDAQSDSNGTPDRAEPLPLPATLNGQLALLSSGMESDCFRVTLSKGAVFTAELEAARLNPQDRDDGFEASLSIATPDGKPLVSSGPTPFLLTDPSFPSPPPPTVPTPSPSPPPSRPTPPAGSPTGSTSPPPAAPPPSTLPAAIPALPSRSRSSVSPTPLPPALPSLFPPNPEPSLGSPTRTRLPLTRSASSPGPRSSNPNPTTPRTPPPQSPTAPSLPSPSTGSSPPPATRTRSASPPKKTSVSTSAPSPRLSVPPPTSVSPSPQPTARAPNAATTPPTISSVSSTQAPSAKNSTPPSHGRPPPTGTTSSPSPTPAAWAAPTSSTASNAPPPPTPS